MPRVFSSKSFNAANTSGNSKTFTFWQIPKNIGRKGSFNMAFRSFWDVVTSHAKHLKPSHRTSQRPIRTSTTQAAKVCKSGKFTMCLQKETPQQTNLYLYILIIMVHPFIQRPVRPLLLPLQLVSTVVPHPTTMQSLGRYKGGLLLLQRTTTCQKRCRAFFLCNDHWVA